jgi:hypothetical protein
VETVAATLEHLTAEGERVGLANPGSLVFVAASAEEIAARKRWVAVRQGWRRSTASS